MAFVETTKLWARAVESFTGGFHSNTLCPPAQECIWTLVLALVLAWVTWWAQPTLALHLLVWPQSCFTPRGWSSTLQAACNWPCYCSAHLAGKLPALLLPIPRPLFRSWSCLLLEQPTAIVQCTRHLWSSSSVLSKKLAGGLCLNSSILSFMHDNSIFLKVPKNYQTDLQQVLLLQSTKRQKKACRANWSRRMQRSAIQLWIIQKVECSCILSC